MDTQALLALLRAEVLPTMGCTEPGAVALAAAYAAAALPSAEVARVEAAVSGNVYKNGVAVGVPGTGEVGLAIAAALGALVRQPERQLAVLAAATPPQVAAAKALLARGAAEVHVAPDHPGLWVQVRVYGGQDECEAVIRDKHTNLVSLSRNGAPLPLARAAASAVEDPRAVLRGRDVTVAGIIEAVEDIPPAELEFIGDGIDMNVAAAREGIARRLGLGIGASFAARAGGARADDLAYYAKTIAAAAAEARMSGENVPVMSSAGSGNHGITVILPVYAVAERRGAPRERLLRAVALSHLLTVYIKMHTGNLSALCGCAVAAATGASAAITWLLGGDAAAVAAAMKNVIADLTGMICDGGKVGCALKLSTAAATAVDCAQLALQGIVIPADNGILADSVEDTIRNLGQVSNPGMVHTDAVIMAVMQAKGA